MYKRHAGFSLIELAVAMIIVALLSAGALVALRVQTQRAQLQETRQVLSEAREALINFAAVNGALPCPATDTAGDAGACSAGAASRGRLPWRLLGVQGADPWGQVIHYSVTNAYTSQTSLQLTRAGAVRIVRFDAAGVEEDLASTGAVVLALWSAGSDAESSSQAPLSVAHVVAESPTSDDVVVWLSRFVLLGRMLEAGRTIPN